MPGRGGKLIVSGVDLPTDSEHRPEARQLLFSLKTYMALEKFTPETRIDIENVKTLVSSVSLEAGL